LPSTCRTARTRDGAPLIKRKTRLKRLLGRRKRVLRYVEHLDEGGAEMFAHAGRLGLEGIVSTRRDLGYRSGRSAAWLKIKNPGSTLAEARAVKRSPAGEGRGWEGSHASEALGGELKWASL
jgi:hypothetical protein